MEINELEDNQTEPVPITKDEREAMKWYRKAAEQGNAGAQFSLSLMYGQGRGVTQDVREAVEWLHKAAEGGMAEAQCILGMMYHKGEPVSKDLVQAYIWISLAASQRHKSVIIDHEWSEVIEIKNNLKKGMNRSQIQEANRLIKAWKSEHPG